MSSANLGSVGMGANADKDTVWQLGPGVPICWDEQGCDVFGEIHGHGLANWVTEESVRCSMTHTWDVN